jgi:hypothetical protein
MWGVAFTACVVFSFSFSFYTLDIFRLLAGSSIMAVSGVDSNQGFELQELFCRPFLTLYIF